MKTSKYRYGRLFMANLVGEMESLKIIDEVNLVRNRPIMNPKMNKNVY